VRATAADVIAGPQLIEARAGRELRRSSTSALVVWSTVARSKAAVSSSSTARARPGTTRSAFSTTPSMTVMIGLTETCATPPRP
jgi:hypothetical protein